MNNKLKISPSPYSSLTVKRISILFVLMFLLSIISISPSATSETNPTITDFGVTPGWGYIDTSFSFFMNYTNPDNDSLISVKVYGGPISRNMEENSTSDTNLTDGKYYFYSTDFNLTRGIHDYYFEVIANNTTTTSSIKQLTVVNRKPYFLEMPPVKIYVGTLYCYKARIHDPDGDEVTYEWVWNFTAGDWVNWSQVGNTFCGVPARAFVRFVNVTLSDGFDSDYVRWEIRSIDLDGEKGGGDIPFVHGGNTPLLPTGNPEPTSQSDDPEPLSPDSFLSSPNAEGHELDWTPKGGGDHYVEVDDTPGSPDDDTTYISVSSGNQEDYWQLTDHTTESGTISNVRLYLRLKHDTGGEEFAFAIADSINTEWVSADVTDSTSWTTYYYDHATNPITSLDWTWTDIDGLQLGIKSRAIGGWGGTQYCTMGYIDVTYTPAAGNTAPTIDDPIAEEHWLDDVAMSHQWNATDPDDDTWTWTVESDPTASFLGIEYDDLTAWVNGSCRPEGTYTIWTNISDGTDSDSDEWNLICNNQLPTIDDKIAEEHWNEDSNVVHQWNSSDSDLDPHTWTVQGNATFMGIEYDNRTAWMNGSCEEQGYFNLWTNVTDGTSSDSDAWVLYCDNVAPTISDKITEEHWTDAVATSHQWNSSDSDEDSHTWSYYSNASFFTLQQDNRTAWLNGTCTSPGDWYNVWTNVTDGTNSDSDDWVLYCDIAPPGGSTTFYWIGLADGGWDDAGNWDPNTDYPKDADDIAYIDDGATPDIIIQDGANSQITLGDIILNATYTGTLTSNIDVILDNSGAHSGHATLAGGTWDLNSKDLYLDGNWLNTATTISNPARLIVQGGVTQDITSNSQPWLNITVDNVASTIFYVKDNIQMFDLTILAAGTFEIDAVSEGASLTLSFTDSANCGFVSSSSGTLLAQGDVTDSVTITTADGSPPPTNYWTFDTYTPIVADYTTFDYYYRPVRRASFDIDNCIFDHSNQEGFYVHTGSSLTSFNDNTIQNPGTDGFDWNLAGAFATLNNIVITSPGLYDIQSAKSVRLEFTNSNFDETNIDVGTGLNVISDTHNDISNNYKIICTSLSKSSITIDFTGADNVEIVSNGGTFTIDEDAASNNFWVQTNTVLSQDSATAWTVTGGANITINGTMESSGTIEYSGTSWYSFYVNYNSGGRLWLNDSTVSHADLIIPFRYSISDATTTTVDELQVGQTGDDIDINITIRDFSVKDSASVLKFKAIGSSSTSTIFTVDNLTIGQYYEVLLDDGHYLYLSADDSAEIYWTYTEFSTRTFEIKWVSRDEALGIEPKPPHLPIQVYTKAEYDPWTNKLRVDMWWNQSGGGEDAKITDKYLIVVVDGKQLNGFIPAPDTITYVDMPWGFFDGNVHNITVIGYVRADWSWGIATYYSDPDHTQANNFPRFLVLMMMFLIILVFIVSVMLHMVNKKRELRKQSPD